MLQKLYDRYIAPRDKDEDARNRELVLNILLVGAFISMLLALTSLIQRQVVGEGEKLPTIVSVLIMLAVTGGIYALSRNGRHKLAGFSFILLYFLIAIGASLTWGLTMPANIGLFSFIVVLCGILIGARYSLYGFASVVVGFIVLRLLQTNGVYQPNLEWTTDPAGSDELIGVCLMLGVIAIVSWLFNVRMERSLRRAERAERALQRQKAELEKIVEKRTRELQATQLEKVQELYRFAELGQLSTALMHELANHLTTLNIDIESLEDDNRSQMLKRTKRSMGYIDKMVLQVRDQLRGKTHNRTFNAASEIEAVIGILQHKAVLADVALEWQPPKAQKLQVHGDALRLRQLLANIVSNAIDAYDEELDDRRVVVSASIKRGLVQITVEDWGRGIPEADKPKLFDPFFGTKKRGLGLGLFIARQIAQDHFGGNIRLDASKSHTVFVITLKAHAPS
jgi:signal transduction histidine kinase